jgi:hypothetical protein
MDTNSRKMQYAKLMPVLAVGLLLALAADPAYATRFRIPVTLDGAQQVPPVTPAGTGTARLLVNTITRRITGVVNFSGLTSATLAGHIHRAPAGVNGGVIIPLSGGLGVTSGRMTVNATLTAAQLRSLMTNKLYLNIHTVNNGNGEIRGQIRWVRRVRLASAEQVPMLTVASGVFSIERLGRELVEPSSEGSMFVSGAWAVRGGTPGDRMRLVKEDLARNRLDELGD